MGVSTLALWSLGIYVKVSRAVPFRVCALSQWGGWWWGPLGMDVRGVQVYAEI